MNAKRITTLLMAALLALALASCGMGSGKAGMENKSSSGAMDSMDSKQDMGATDAMDGKKEMDTMGATDGKQDMDAMDTMDSQKDMDTMEQFPAFEGMDLEGKAVKSEELFGGSAATVVNFWFTTCGPCVGELSELDALNRELSEKGAALIGINAFTLGGDKAAIADAKDMLAKKGATYQNIYFDADSPAGTFASGLLAFPTTYVVDRHGAIVGEPIVGALTESRKMDMLRQQIDQALAKDTEQM